MPKKVASSVLTTAQSDEERTLTSTHFGSAPHEEGAFGSLGVSWLDEAFGSAEVPASATSAQSTSSDGADCPDSTPGLPTGALTFVANQPNRWCVDG